MRARMIAVVGLLALAGLVSAAPRVAVGEDGCAAARRTCEAWCEENRGGSGECRADCRRRYQRCKRSGWFIWGRLAPDAGSARCSKIAS